MKRNIYLSVICLLAVSAFSFISCDKDDDGDTTKPVITLNDPEEGAIIKIGDDDGLHFDMDLSDDVDLKSYKVEIHSNFDGHDHSRATRATVAFDFKKSWEVSGKNAHVHHHEINIPDDATPGDYHLVVYCTDAAGNETHIARNIELSHDGEEHEH